MSDNSDITFAAVVTITLPAENGSTQLEVTLAPSDRIEASDGAFKPIGDCTLADLRRFASAMEAEAWAEHENATLYELVAQHEVDISFAVSDEIALQATPEELSLESAINLEDGVEQNGDKPVTTAAGQEDVEALSKEVATEGEGDFDGLAPDEEDAGEILTDEGYEPEGAAVEEAEAAEADVEIELDVTVAESEPVHEEREAAPTEEELETDVTVVRPEVRILGKRRPLDHPTWTAVDILMNESAFRDAQAHALSSPGREVAGVLVGPQPEKQPDGRYVVHISDAIIARHTRMQGASVTYTPESWRYVNDRLAELFPDGTAVIVGWYHTHPGFGIFMSGMDQFIHRNFFTQIWHVAMVLDPLATSSGFFCWNREKDNVAAYEFPWPNWAADSW